jgi:intracellular sulfur oxidation DsrE/DsrF family protein
MITLPLHHELSSHYGLLLHSTRNYAINYERKVQVEIICAKEAVAFVKQQESIMEVVSTFAKHTVTYIYHFQFLICLHIA